MTRPHPREHECRQMALKDGIDPDIKLAGSPAWRMYIDKLPKIEPEPIEMPAEMKALFERAARREVALEKLHAEADDDAATVSRLLKGKRMRAYKGVYEVEYIHAAWNGGFEGKGYKIVADGSRGKSRFGLGRITRQSFKGD